MEHVHTIIGKIDFFRAGFLKVFLKMNFIRSIYSKCAMRLGVGYLLTLLFYFPISLVRPDILLLTGPLIFGYPHLIASFRYVQKMNVGLFASLTLICVLGHWSGLGISFLREFPFGAWQILVAMIALLISNIISRHYPSKLIIFSLLLCCGLLYFSYQEAIIFAGGILILHNWIGYFYWMMASKVKSRRAVAIMAFGIFALIHLLVLRGHFDAYFPISSREVNFPGETRATGWFLASWTENSIVWYRLLVLYAFGLSMHYFVWLRAIPQSLNPIEHPNNSRLSLKCLREDIGDKLLLIFALVSMVGILIWLFSFALGARIYFEIAILHGALEIVFLLPKMLSPAVERSSFK